MDGWEEDDDLEIDSHSQENVDGWNDDTDTAHLDFLQDGEGDQKGEWSFDDDEILEGDDDVDETKPFHEGSTTRTEHVARAHAMPTDKCSRNTVGMNIVGDKVTTLNRRKEQEQWKEPADEWDFENDDIGEDELAEPAASQKEEALFQSLVRYLDLLPAILPSLNAVLEAEYNTYQHAKDLNDYYKSRPQLYDYTLETELPRMDYEVVLPNRNRLTNKDDIKQYLSSGQNQDNLLIRASNQSLLADLLTVLTGPDCFIQHQYLATAMARKCRFVIHPTFVDCVCEMHLTLPTSSGDRLDVARLHLSIQFDQSPSVTYRLHTVESLPHNLSALRDTAALLSSMDHDLFLHDDYDDDKVKGSDDDVVRDAFLARLSQTQQFVEASHHGLSRAWKQIDSVANVSSKLDFIKKGLTLPSTENVLASSEVTTAFESSVPRPAFPHRPAPPVNVAKQASIGPPPRPPPSNVHRGPPPPPRPQDRPAPILGGLLRSGWNRLAQSVTLPDEEEVYFPSEKTQVVPKLYRSENEVREHASQSKPSPDIIQGTTRRHIQDAPAPPSKEADHEDILPLPGANVRDGWDDDDDDLDLDDDLIVGTPNSRPPPPPRPPQTVGPPRPPPPPAVLPPPKVQPGLPSQRTTTSPVAVALVDYNPEDDIMPTRKRWVNPRPGNRQIQTR